MKRSGNTYRAAKRNARRELQAKVGRQVAPFRKDEHHPHANDVVAQLMRGWLMRRRGVLSARAAPTVQMGPSKRGKCLVATHLTISKEWVREAARLAKTGIRCDARQPNKAGSTHDWGSMRYHWLVQRLHHTQRAERAEVAAYALTPEGIRDRTLSDWHAEHVDGGG